MTEYELTRRGFIVGASVAGAITVACGHPPVEVLPTPTAVATAAARARITPEPAVHDSPDSRFWEVHESKYWSVPKPFVSWYPKFPYLHHGNRNGETKPIFYVGEAKKDQPQTWGALQGFKEIWYRKFGYPFTRTYDDPIEVAIIESEEAKKEAIRNGESYVSHGMCAYVTWARHSLLRPIIIEGQTYYGVPVEWDAIVGMYAAELFPFKGKLLSPPGPQSTRGGKGADMMYKEYNLQRDRLRRVAYSGEMKKERDGSKWVHLVVGISPLGTDPHDWVFLRTNDYIDPDNPIIEDSTKNLAGLYLPFNGTEERFKPNEHHDLDLDKPEAKLLIHDIAQNRDKILHRFAA